MSVPGASPRVGVHPYCRCPACSSSRSRSVHRQLSLSGAPSSFSRLSLVSPSRSVASGTRLRLALSCPAFCLVLFLAGSAPFPGGSCVHARSGAPSRRCSLLFVLLFVRASFSCSCSRLSFVCSGAVSPNWVAARPFQIACMGSSACR